MSNTGVRIGVFDSGIGGLSVARAIRKGLPDAEVEFVDDRKNLPYGSKTSDELYELVLPILNELSISCQVIVIACNTVTTTIINRLRKVIPVPLIGMEPMVKPAAKASKSGVIAVCATPATLSSERYQWLKSEYASGVRVFEPDCSDWALLIEENKITQRNIQEDVESIIATGADVIVLGCTHYHWIEKLMQKLVAGRAIVIQPEAPVVAQLKRVIGGLDI